MRRFFSQALSKLNLKPEVCYYKTMNVSADADPEAIKKSYFKMAKKYHPDVNPTPEAQEKYQTISQAYDVLMNPEARKQYDLTLGITDPSWSLDKHFDAQFQNHERFLNELAKEEAKEKLRYEDMIRTNQSLKPKSKEELDRLDSYFQYKYLKNPDNVTIDRDAPMAFSWKMFKKHKVNQTQYQDVRIDNEGIRGAQQRHIKTLF